jgi:hypothetical protein
MSILKLVQKYFSKKHHQKILNELDDFYDNVKTGIKIAKQSPSSKKKIKVLVHTQAKIERNQPIQILQERE